LVMRRTNLKNMDSNTSDLFMNTTTTRINMSKPLIEMSVQDVCEEIDNTIDYMNDEFKQIYKSFLRENNISGKVLACCELDELKAELKMTFGDWQLFKNWILNQRAAQVSVDYIPSKKDSVDTKDNFYKLKQQAQEKANVYQEPEKPVEKNKLPEEQQQPKASMPNRKVEFFITPVVEYVNHESKHEPPKSILVKQASEQANSLSQTMSSSSSLQQDSSSAMLLNTSRNEKINEDGYYANLTPIQKNSDQTQNAVSKIGKKIFSLINNSSVKKSSETRSAKYDSKLKENETKLSLLSLNESENEEVSNENEEDEDNEESSEAECDKIKQQ